MHPKPTIPLNLYNSDLELERPIETSTWPAPHRVRINKRRLIWEGIDNFSEKPSARSISAGRGMLERFVELHRTSDPRKIADYLLRWGPLNVAREWEQDVLETRHSGIRRKCWAINNHVPDGYLRDSEPIHIWRYWSSRFAAALRVGSALRSGKMPVADDWYDIDTSLYGAKRNKPAHTFASSSDPETVKNYLFYFTSILAGWLDFSGARLGVYGITTPCLFSALMMQLIPAVFGSKGYAFCSACGRMYSPLRHPRGNEKHYCQKKECLKAANAEHARRSRQKAKLTLADSLAAKDKK